MKKVGLVVTKISIEEDFSRGRYKSKFNIETIISNEEDRSDIHQIIYEEIVKGIVKEKSKFRIVEAIDKLIGQGAEGIISGCTEIELLITPRDKKVELFETTKLHAEKAVKHALAK